MNTGPLLVPYSDGPVLKCMLLIVAIIAIQCSGGGLINKPINYRTITHDLNAGLVLIKIPTVCIFLSFEKIAFEFEVSFVVLAAVCPEYVVFYSIGRAKGFGFGQALFSGRVLERNDWRRGALMEGGRCAEQ